MSTLTLAPTTELDAVNILLDVTNKPPVNTLEGGLPLDVTRARVRLHEISRAVQKKGWHFNTRPNVAMYPDNTGTIQIGTEVLSIDSAGSSATRDVVQRGTRLFDRDNDTYTFTVGTPLYAQIVEFLAFEELPEAARYYIAVRAARTFQQRTTGSDTRFKFTAADEQAAWEELVQDDAENAGYNMITGSLSTYRIVNRKYPNDTGL